MRIPANSFVALLATCLLTLAMGCGRSEAPVLENLSMAEVPGAIEKAFASAKAPLKEMAGQIQAAVQAQDYAKAHQVLQNLLNQPGLSKAQQTVIARASITVSAALQAAQAEGDKKAAQTIKTYQLNK